MNKAKFTIGSEQLELTAAEAQEKGHTRGICPTCGHSVRLHRKLKPNAQAAHFEHLQHDKACPLAYKGYE